jgi:hypothetical protein
MVPDLASVVTAVTVVRAVGILDDGLADTGGRDAKGD